jgi:hypothetical protein
MYNTTCMERYELLASESWFMSRSVLVLGSLNLIKKKKHVKNIHRNDLKVNGNLKMNLRETACGGNDI